MYYVITTELLHAILSTALNLLFLDDVMSPLSSLYHPLMRGPNLNTKSCSADN